MTAKQRLEELTNTWLGFTIFSGIASVVEVALWPFAPGLLFSPVRLALTIVGSAIATIFAIGLNVVAALIAVILIRLLGRALLRGSTLVRVGLVVLSPVCAVLMAIGALDQGWDAVRYLSLSSFVAAAISGIAAALCFRSFRTLLAVRV
jgi:hypothetical protein